MYVSEDAFDGAGESTWRIAAFGSAPSSVAVVYLMLDGDEVDLDTLTPELRVGYEVFGAVRDGDRAAVAAAIGARLSYCRHHADLVAGHQLHLIGPWADAIDPAPGTAQVFDTATGPAHTLQQRCEREGVLLEHLGRDSPRAACTAALSCALIAAPELGMCTWSPPLELDDLIPESDVAQLCER